MGTRAGNGQGNLKKYHHKGKYSWDGWRGQYTDPITHKQKAVYAKTYAECKEKLDIIHESIRKNAYVEPSRETVADWLNYWFENLYVPTVKRSTAATAATNIRTHIIPALGNIQLQKLSLVHIQKFSNDCLASGMRPTTVKRILAVLQKAMSQALILQKISRDPFIGFRSPKNDKREINPLSESEQIAWLAVIPNTTNGRALRFLYSTGLRVSELVGLRWSDIQTDGIHIEHNLSTIHDWQDGGYVEFESTPKTEKGKRIIPFNKRISELLEAQRTAQIREKLRAGAAWTGGEPGNGGTFVFTTATGNHLDRDNLNRAFRGQLKKAGVPERGVHSLRHTFATNAVQSGECAISDLAKLLGHSDASFTLRTYVHPNQDAMQRSMESIDRITPW